MYNKLLSLVLVAAVAAVAATLAGAQPEPDLIRTVTGGRILGARDSLYPNIGVWKNVPFASAQRFLPPGPVVPWSGLADGTKWGAGCPCNCDFPHAELTCAASINESTCLNLNVFTPVLSANSSQLLPVMFFIPGGAFQQGAGGVKLYQGSSIASNQGVVVVTMTYRLLAFGSLVSPTPGSPITGNMMIKDQRAALLWCKNNIARFGGDPSRITISGESAGGISVGIHTLASPKSQGLFAAAIVSSNPLGLPIQSMKKSQDLGAKFIKACGCDGRSAADELACLQALPAELIVNVSMSTRNSILDGLLDIILPWQPTVDGDEIIGQQIALVEAGAALGANVPMLISNNYQDVFLFVAEVSPNKAISYTEANILLGVLFGLENALELRVKYFPYDKNKYPENDAREMLGDIMTAYLMTCPARKLGRSRQNPNTALAIFSVLPSTNAWFWETPGSKGHAYWDCGEYAQICHATDLAFLFNSTSFDPTAPLMSGQDYYAGRIWQNIYGSFVRTQGATTGVPGWSPATAGTDDRYFLRAPGSGVVKGYQGDVCDYMDKNMNYNDDSVSRMRSALAFARAQAAAKKQ